MTTQKKKGKKILRTILWIVAALIVVSIISTVLTKGKNKGYSYEIVTPVQNDSVIKSTVLTGSIEPRDEVKVKPQMNGIVAELLHLPGDFVQAGELIARIQMVPDVGTVQNAASRVESAGVRLQQLKDVYERDKQLFDQNILPKEQYERSLAEYKGAEIDYNSAKETLELVTKGSSARTAKQNNTLVRATVTGTILEQPVKVGTNVIQANNFNEGTTIVSIADLTDLLFIGEVNESDVNKLTVGAQVTIRVGAIKDRTFPAVIEYVSPKGVIKSGTVLFEVKAALTGSDLSGIKAGFSSNAEVELDSRRNVLTIPESTVTYRGDQTFVYIAKNGGNKEGDFVEQEVKLGLSDGLKVEVISGLNGDEKLRGNRMSLEASSNQK